MSVTVRHLNADSTFLLIFSHKTDPSPEDLRAANGAYSVLIDPWFVGSSIVNASWFAVTSHVLPSAVQHVSELEEPDLVIISQNKPDHCHRATLTELKPGGKTLIAAEPGAAKVIKKWNHFDPRKVHALPRYSSRARSDNILRLKIPPMSTEGLPGELTVAFIPAKNYATGLHNAFGITYQAPVEVPGSSAHRTFHRLISQPLTLVADGNLHTLDLLVSRDENAPPIHPPTSETLSLLNDDRALSHVFDSDHALGDSSISPSTISRSRRSNASDSTGNTTPLSSCDESFARLSHMSATSKSLSLSDLQHRRPQRRRPKAVSILYTPHGIPLSDLKPYTKTHLISVPGALPLTLLLHSFDSVRNPWWFGGNIISGATGGVEIAKALMARTWISAHDEKKDDRGLAVKLLKTRTWPVELIRQQMTENEDKHGWNCDVRTLDVGAQVKLTGEYEWRKRVALQQGHGRESLGSEPYSTEHNVLDHG